MDKILRYAQNDVLKLIFKEQKVFIQKMFLPNSPENV